MYPPHHHHHHLGTKTFGELAIGDRFEATAEQRDVPHRIRFGHVYVKIPNAVSFTREGRREINAREAHENHFVFVPGDAVVVVVEES